jgi:hypothetical protein
MQTAHRLDLVCELLIQTSNIRMQMDNGLEEAAQEELFGSDGAFQTGCCYNPALPHFFTYILHHPFGLTVPSTVLQDDGGSKTRQFAQLCSPFGVS